MLKEFGKGTITAREKELKGLFWISIILIHSKTCKMMLESMAYFTEYFAAVIGKGDEVKFAASLLMRDIVALLNNEESSVNDVKLSS